MRILFDQGIPVPLREAFAAHTVQTVQELGWSALTDSELLSKAEGVFDVLLTTDLRLKYNRGAPSRKLSILALGSGSWPRIRRELAAVRRDLEALKPGAYIELEFDNPAQI